MIVFFPLSPIAYDDNNNDDGDAFCSRKQLFFFLLFTISRKIILDFIKFFVCLFVFRYDHHHHHYIVIMMNAGFFVFI